MDRILLIDGLNAIFRACIKFESSTPLEEVDDSIVFTFNFFRNLRPLIEEFKPDKCFFVLEGHPQFRYDLFSNYKANRIIKRASKQAFNEKVFRTKDIIVELLQYLPITICRAENYEADDVVSTLCENMKDESLTVISNDSDYIQLLQRNYRQIKVYNPIKKVNMESPSYPYVVWKCLNGDKSDNIPALLKPKKALDTVQSPNLFKAFLEVEENRANFNINRQLIEFKNVPEEEIIFFEGYANFPQLKSAFSDMKFVSLINDTFWPKFVSTFNCLKY